MDIRAIKNPRPKALMENSNSVALLLEDYCKHGNKNPIAKYLSYNIYGVNSKINKIKREKEEELMNFRKKIKTKQKDKRRGYKRDDDDDEDKDYKGQKTPVLKTNQNGEINNTTDNILDLNIFWNPFDKPQKKTEETSQRMEPGPVVNGYYQNIGYILRKDKVDKDYKERVEKVDFKNLGGLFDGKEWRLTTQR